MIDVAVIEVDAEHWELVRIRSFLGGTVRNLYVKDSRFVARLFRLLHGFIEQRYPWTTQVFQAGVVGI